MIAKEVLNWIPREKRPLGRPKQRWFDKISKVLTMLEVENYKEIAMDRERSKEVYIAAMDLNCIWS